MSTQRTIQLKEYNVETNRTEESGEVISTNHVAKSLTLDNFVSLFDDFLNLGGKGFREGKQVGLQMRFTHRTLQRLAVCFALGIIAGLSEQQRTDPRNETAILTAKKIARMLEEGELPLGFYI